MNDKFTGVVIASRGLNVRRTPEAKGSKLGVLPFGSWVNVIGNDGKWLLIDCKGLPLNEQPVNGVGWVYGRWINKVESMPEKKTAVFQFTHYPTPYPERAFNQDFANNPRYYGQFKLPGHEGVDLFASSWAALSS